MAAALETLRAASAANPDSDGFAQGQLTNEMYRRTAELKASVSAAFLRLLCRAGSAWPVQYALAASQRPTAACCANSPLSTSHSVG